MPKAPISYALTRLYRVEFKDGRTEQQEGEDALHAAILASKRYNKGRTAPVKVLRSVIPREAT